MKLLLQVHMPEGKGTPGIDPRYREPCLEERIEQCMHLIESGHESAKEWDIIRYINNALMERHKSGKLNDKQLRILKMIQPIIEKYGQQDPRGVEQSADLHSTVTGEEK